MKKKPILIIILAVILTIFFSLGTKFLRENDEKKPTVWEDHSEIEDSIVYVVDSVYLYKDTIHDTIYIIKR